MVHDSEYMCAGRCEDFSHYRSSPSEVPPLMNLNTSIINLEEKILKANISLACEGKHLCEIMVFFLITIRVIACAWRHT